MPLNPGGTPSDLALDEPRGVLYIADFGSGTIDVLTLADNTIHSSFNVAPFPVGLALSPSGDYLVSVHYGASSTLAGGGNMITVINLNAQTKNTYQLGEAPLAVTFVNTQSGDQGGLAVIATAAHIMTLDPETGVISTLLTLANAPLAIPQKAPALPATFTEAAAGTSGDGWTAWMVFGAGTGSQLLVWYDGLRGLFGAEGWTTTVPLQPRVGVSKDGLHAMIGYAQFNSAMNMVAKYPDAVAVQDIGADAWDSVHNLVYAQVEDANQTALNQPALLVMDADNLAYRDRLNLAENLVGRAVLNKAATAMYAISSSGVSILPIGSLNSYNRVYPGQEDVLIQTSFCNQSQATQTFTLSDPGGNATDFEITTKTPGISVSPSSGVTPASITVTASASAFIGAMGTTVGALTIHSASAVNQPIPVRVLVSNPDEDQRGTVVNVPGILSDIIADQAHNRFYILRQDRNQVLVYDGTNNNLITTLRTMTTPTGMAMAPDPYSGEVNKYLLVANSDSQLISVYNLDSLQAGAPLTLPGSDFGRSIAASNNGILALANDNLTLTGDVVSLSLITGFGTSLASLGPWTNDAAWISVNSVLTASPNGNNILMAGPDGHVSLYSAAAGTFTVSRNDLTVLSGAYAASSYNTYVVGSHLLNSALVPIATLCTSCTSSGFAFVDTGSNASGYFAQSPAFGTPGPGGIEYFPTMSTGSGFIPTVEATNLPTSVGFPTSDGTVSNDGSGANFASQQMSFSRTVAPLTSSGEVVELSTSGFTILGKGYASAFQAPVLKAITNAADDKAAVAPGGLVSIWGTGMSPVSVVASQVPLPTALGESCLSVNGTPVPLLFVSGTQINAQLPNNALGLDQVSVHTPGGVSNSLNFTVSATAPAVFLSGVAGPLTGLPTVIRSDNNQIVDDTNPIRRGDTLVIWLTGMGQTTPIVAAGSASPATPLALASSQPIVTLGGIKLNIEYAGLAPGEVGVNQINVGVPTSVTEGQSQPLVITQGGGTTTLNFRVVGN